MNGTAGAPGAARDEPGALEELEVLADCRLADGEGGGELVHRRIAIAQAGQDRAPGRVGEGNEGGVELFGREHLHNRRVIERYGYGT